MADKPARGLADVVAASTALSDIDGAVGRLSYRGYDINELAGRISFEECVHLLLRSTLPTRTELDDLLADLAAARHPGPTVEAILPYVAAPAAEHHAGVRTAAPPTPMDALRTLVSALSIDDPDAADSAAEANQRKAIRLIAQMPVLVARYHSARTGTDPISPADDLGIAGNFLLQISGRRPSRREDEIFDECLVLHADHTMNASTFTGRVVAATLADMHSAITAAMGALRGPLHGGANEAVMNTLQSIPGGVDGVEQWVRDTLATGKKISGFGHRVYKVEDPRATHLRRITAELAEMRGDPTYYRMSRIMEQTVLEEKGLYPNVDFFAASVYHYLGIPTDLFTPVFAISRMSGWTAHVIEQHLDNRLIRPDSEYVGERDQKWRPIEER